MAARPSDQGETVPAPPSDERGTYHPGDKFSPASPGEEARVVARGERARTPFVVWGAMHVVILAVVLVILGIVILAIWLS